MRRPRLVLPALGASLALAATLTAGSAGANPAPVSAAPTFGQCPAAFPADDLAVGQTVTGLTTAGESRGSGTTPESFTGSYLGTLEDDTGDLLVFDLAGSRVTKADGSIDAGVWSGMSGSPVYAEDGRLVGAVAYTFGGEAPSTIAGVTPAADLYALLDSTTRPAPDAVALSSAQRRALVKAGASTTALGTGARRIAPVAAINLPARFADGYATIARRAGTTPRDVAAGGATLTREVPLVAGGNVAFADAYGSLSSFTLGTVSALCGQRVVAYGHPDNFDAATRTMHGASTLAIQENGGWSFKLGNLAAPLGRQTGDSLAGVTGRLGGLPASTRISSTARRTGGEAKTYSSLVPNPFAVAELSATHAFRDAVLAQGKIGGGESLVTYTVKGKAKVGGKAVELKRTQRFSERSFLAEMVGTDVASDVYALQDNEFSEVTVGDVTIDDTLGDDYKALKIGSIDRYYDSRRGWGRLAPEGTLTVAKGKPFTLRFNLVPADRWSKAKKASLVMEIRTSGLAQGRGRLTIDGGAYDEEDFEEFEDLIPWEEDDDFFDGEDDPLSLPEKEPRTAQEVAALLSKQPRQDDVLVSQDFVSSRDGVVNSDRRLRAASIVSGSFEYTMIYK